MENNKGSYFFKKSKGSLSQNNDQQIEPARKLKYSDSPFEIVIRDETSDQTTFHLESEDCKQQDSPNLRSSSRKLFFDLEVDKENIDPQHNKREKMNNLCVPKSARKETSAFLDALTLRRNHTDVPIEEERNQNTDNEFFIFSQPLPDRKSSITDFSSFKLTKLRSDCSDKSTGNCDFFSQGLPSFEETKPCLLNFCSSQPNPECDEEGLETKCDPRDVDSTKENSDCTNSDLPDQYTPFLEVVKNLKNPDLFHITPETLYQLDASNKPYIIVDCRYDYEYTGGHIPGAINIRCPAMLERVFFTNRQLLQNSNYLKTLKTDFDTVIDQLQGFEQFDQNYPQDQDVPIIIFHCEFSQKRGPRALRALRNMDREINQSRWPYIFYPEVYILEGGYRNFHGTYGECCIPKNGYVEMIDKSMKKEFIFNKEFERKHWDKKKTNLPGLHRSKTICEF